MKGITRDSNMELLRLLAIFFIVMYHLGAFYINSTGYNNSLIRAMILLLHTGVLLFVLISGYYGIRFSFRGLLKLLTILFIYYVPLMLVYHMQFFASSMVDIVCFISRTPYWYIRTYLILFVLSPIINTCIATVNIQQRVFLLIVLSVVSIYIGMQGKDPSLSTGKNIVCFFNLYLIGNTIKLYKGKLNTIFKRKYIWIWLLYNVIMVSLNILFKDNIFGKFVYVFGYRYCSPGLLINAVLLFLAFTDIRICSKGINYMASSVLAVYLIQEHPYVRYYLRMWIRNIIQYFQENDWLIVMSWIGCSILVVIVCICIDKLFTPLWRLSMKVGKNIDDRINLDF